MTVSYGVFWSCLGCGWLFVFSYSEHFLCAWPMSSWFGISILDSFEIQLGASYLELYPPTYGILKGRDYILWRWL